MQKKNKEKFWDSTWFPIILAVGLVLLMSIFVVWHEKGLGSTRPDDEDGDFIYIQDQMTKFHEFGEDEECPIEFYLPDSRRRLVHSVGPENCHPLHSEPHFSTWKPKCFYWVNLVGNGLEFLLYSHKCKINIYTTMFGEGI